MHNPFLPIMKLFLKFTALGMLMLLAWTFLRPEPVQAGLGGQVEVKRIELAYRPDSGMIKARVHLTTGIAVDWTARDDREQKVILKFAEIFSHRASRMTVTMEEDRVLGYQISIP